MSDSLQHNGLQHTTFPVHYQVLEPPLTHVHRVGDALQPWLMVLIIFFVWLSIVKTDKHQLLLSLFNYYSLNYMSQESPNSQAEFRKDRGTRDQIANIQ